jgi:hypothetical protein
VIHGTGKCNLSLPSDIEITFGQNLTNIHKVVTRLAIVLGSLGSHGKRLEAE